MESRGIIMFNRGEKCIVRAIVCLYSLRQHYNGPVTFYLEDPYPHEFDDVCRYFHVDIIHNQPNHELKTLVRKTDMFGNPPYDRTMWLDSDVVVLGKIDAMFDFLDNADVSIPHFAGWVSSGNTIKGRIERFRGLIDDEILNEAMNNHPAINTGVLSFKKSDNWRKFVQEWVVLADKGSKKHIFIPDEVAFQILYPQISKWGLKIHIAPTDYNMSVLHDHGHSKDPRILHYHGQKSVLDHPNCDIFKRLFKEMCDKNIANINAYLKYADKRIAKYIRTQSGLEQDVTIVTACDNYYVDILRETFPNWRKYKNIDKYPVIVFVHGMNIETDPRLNFLRLPNVRMIPWSMPSAESHREEMLSAFVFGCAQYVQTEYWLKLDADSYATDDRPFINEKMKQFAFCGHKWGYSRPEHIKKLDEWAKGHWKRKLRFAKPMINEGRIEGNRFYHNTRRTISFIQLHRTRFTKFCVNLIKEDPKTHLKRLPAPTQDTFMFYVANRFNPETVGVMNFKRDFGFTQGKGKLGAEHIKQQLKLVDQMFETKKQSSLQLTRSQLSSQPNNFTSSRNIEDNDYITSEYITSEAEE